MTTASGQPDELTTVFVMTYRRSGSTLLHAIMNAMQDLIIRGKNSLALAPLLESWRRIKKNKNKFARVANTAVLRPESDRRIVGYKEIRYNGFIKAPAEALHTAEFVGSTVDTDAVEKIHGNRLAH